MELPVQFDNINRRVVDDLKEKLTAASSLSVAAASFSIYAFEALKKELEAVRELRFIFTSPAFNKETAKKQQREFYIPKLNRERNLYALNLRYVCAISYLKRPSPVSAPSGFAARCVSKAMYRAE